MKTNVVLIVLKKELLDMFRDRKTILMSILIPMLLLPVLSFVIGKATSTSHKNVESNLKIAVVDKGSSNLGSFFKSQKNVKIIKSNNIKQDVKDGKILAGITIPENFDENISKDMNEKITLTYDNSSSDSMEAFDILNSYIDKYSKNIVSKRLEKRNIDSKILTPINVAQDTIEKKESGIGKLMLNIMVPLLLILGSVGNTVAPSLDLGVGEKERGTLEPLLTTKASRMSLLWGKFLAITIVGIIVSLANLAGLFISMNQTNGMFQGANDINIGLETIILIMILPILLTMVFGALGLSISIYAKSSKEAQTYLSPFTIIAVILVYATMMKDAKSIETYFFSIPIANASCLTKEFLVGIHNTAHIAITFGWMIVYIVAAISFARYMFNKESVIFRS
ncbi:MULTISPECIES: ABC transporter permease [Clostridium]|uniref:ABC-2 family transporter protein n=3 Tax=Clostridium TaxID=1485 RepID=D8GTC2_CLOLD|nr:MULTISPECIES: ABC transporter permease [Clostridium]ADK14571.1 predicted Na+ ABC transporter, permease component [Clostridium ljungdahlii DSM 13528]OAA85808.1 ABC-2 family transporter protein [Clostridium ljungdahlii DSM 13528]OAA90112.1 ABC-2 family transporter protein [Clostridium coskatii]OBR92754.1 ABC-2 family transporter protein [Clostridium coskatii]RMC99492.1 ABC transporter permease [Clostridium autoethanogenum]